MFPDSETVWQNIIKTAIKLEDIRAIFNRSITITSWYRPQSYNDLIGGAKNSSHRLGLAVDFLVTGVSSAEVRRELRPRLEALDIRCEAIETPHVHIDLATTPKMPESARFFIP